MIVRIVRMEFRPDSLHSFHQLFDRFKHQIRMSPGCHTLELHHDAQHINVRYTYSIWESEEALNNYRHSELFQQLWPQTKALFSGKVRAYSLVSPEIILPPTE